MIDPEVKAVVVETAKSLRAKGATWLELTMLLGAYLDAKLNGRI